MLPVFDHSTAHRGDFVAWQSGAIDDVMPAGHRHRDDDFVANSHKFDAGGDRVALTQPFWYTRSIADQNYNNDEVQIWTEDH